MEKSSEKKVIIHEVAVQEILKLIADNGLKAGDKLPTERELVQRFNISRSSIREALKLLESNFVVRIKHGSGIYVDAFDESTLSWYKNDSNDIKVLNLIKNTVEARILLETYAFQQAAKAITPEQVQALYEEEEMEYIRMRKNKNSSGIPGISFEHLIISYQSNPILTNLHKRLSGIWKSYHDIINSVALPLEVRHKDHLAIIKAIANNNPNKIAKAVTSHLKKTADAIDNLLTQR